jgi:hypothetical protein
MDLEWDELSMVDDIVAELRCFSLPYGLGECHFDLAAKDDLDDLADEGVDLRMWAGECVVVDVDDEEDEQEVVEQLLDGTYDVEDAVWIEDSGDDEEEAEVEEEFPAGFDDSVLGSDNDNAAGLLIGADDTFDLSTVLLGFYGPDGSKADLLVNVVPPEFDSADVLDVLDDFDPALEDLFVPKWSVPGLFEDGSPSSVPALDDPAVVNAVKHDVPTPDFAVELPNGADDTFDLSDVLLDFYGPDGSKAELLVNVVPPDFKTSDVLDVCNDFDPDLFVSKGRVRGLLEDGWLYRPSSSSVPAQDDVLPLDRYSAC